MRLVGSDAATFPDIPAVVYRSADRTIGLEKTTRVSHIPGIGRQPITGLSGPRDEFHQERFLALSDFLP
jgi:hypothetical protein